MEKPDTCDAKDVVALRVVCASLVVAVIVCIVIVHLYGDDSGIASMAVLMAALSGFQLSIVARRLLAIDDKDGEVNGTQSSDVQRR